MVNFLKHIFWGLLFPVFIVLYATYGARFGAIFWVKYGYASAETMMYIGVTLICTALLGSIWRYCGVVNNMEI